MRTAALAWVSGFSADAEPGSRIYDALEFQRWVDREGYAGRLGTYVPQPPAALLPYAPFCWLADRPARIAFSTLSLLALLVASGKLAAHLELDPLEHAASLAAIGGALTANLANGQSMMLMTAILMTALRLAGRGRWFESGVLTGITLGLKLVPLPWLVLLALRRRLGALVATGGSLLLVTAVAGAGLGPEALKRYQRDILPSSLAGSYHNLYHPASQSVETVLRRLLLSHPDWNPSPMVDAPLIYGILSRAWPLAVMGLAVAAVLPSRRSDATSLALLLAAMLLAAPIVTRYHLLLLLPALMVAMSLQRGNWRRHLLLLVPVAISSFAPQGPILPLQEPRLLGLAAVTLALMLAIPPSRKAATAVALGVAVLSLAMPVRRGAVPEGWTRVTETPFVPIVARFPARDGSGLELSYRDEGSRTRFRWPGYAWDRSASLNRVFERLTNTGRSGIQLTDALGTTRWLVRLPDADCRLPRFLARDRLLFLAESGSSRLPYVVDLTGTGAAPAPEAAYPAELATPGLSEPDVSRNGDHVAFVRRVGGRTEIRELHRPTGRLRTLVEAVGLSIDPRYSWDGTRLFFASDVGRCHGCTVIYSIPWAPAAD